MFYALAAFGLFFAPAHAAPGTDVASLPSTRDLYCAGSYGSIASHTLNMNLSMEDDDIAWMERPGDVTCRFIEKHDVWFVEESGLRTNQGSFARCVRFYEYRLQMNDPANYGLANGAELYRWEWVECRK